MRYANSSSYLARLYPASRNIIISHKIGDEIILILICVVRTNYTHKAFFDLLPEVNIHISLRYEVMYNAVNLTAQTSEK